MDGGFTGYPTQCPEDMRTYEFGAWKLSVPERAADRGLCRTGKIENSEYLVQCPEGLQTRGLAVGNSLPEKGC